MQTRRARIEGSSSGVWREGVEVEELGQDGEIGIEGAINSKGWEAQYVLYSRIDCGERRNGGAVIVEMSPRKVASD